MPDHILLETDNPLTAGMIFMWSGSPLAVPMGWNLCDGTNSTPDLSGRFIVSYDVAEPLFDTIGNLGGNFSAQPAGAHTHGGASGTTLKASDIPTLPLTTHLSTSNNSGDDHQFVNQPSAGANSNDFAATEAVEYVNATPTPHPHDMQNSGTHFHEAVPVYYTLAYIQFAGVAIPPIFTGTLADQAYAEGEAIAPIDTTLLFNEGNGLTPTYSAVNLPAGLSIVATGVGRGVISGPVDVGAASLSPYAVQVTLTTSLGAADSNIANWTVVVNPNLPVPGFSIWLNPDTLTTLGGNVTGWANDLTATRGTQADTNAQGAAIPESTDPTTGLAIVEAPDVTLRSLVAATPFVISSGFTLFVVGRLDPASSGGTLVDMDTTPGDRAIVNTSGATLTISGDDVGVITTLANDNLPHVFACRYDSTSYRARISGQPVWTISGVGIAQNWNYGKFLQSFTPNNQQAIGWIGELVVYEEGLSDVQMDALFDYYLNKWSL